MPISSRIRSLIVGGAALAMVPISVAVSQEVPPSTMAAALDAVVHVPLTRDFDNILPTLADQTTTRLISTRPDLHKQIGDAVNDTALKLAARRADLDNDLARVWAKSFTEDELRQIAAFYKSPAGQKLVSVGPKLAQDSVQAATNWSDRLGDELYQKSLDELKKRGVNY